MDISMHGIKYGSEITGEKSYLRAKEYKKMDVM